MGLMQTIEQDPRLDRRRLFATALEQYGTGQLPQAEASCRRILQAEPDHANALHLLGCIARKLGQTSLAIALIRKAIALQPEVTSFHTSLGRACLDAHRLQDAVATYQHALMLDPDDTRALANLGVAYQRLNQPDDAVVSYQRALAIEPGHATALSNLGQALTMQGRPDDAAAIYQRELACRPQAGLEVRLATLLPVIPRSADDLRAWRARFAAELDRLLTTNLALDDPLKQVGQTAFYLAYHGLDDRPLQEKLARFYAQACPSLHWTAPHCRTVPRAPAAGSRYRVGFVSKFLHDHTIGNLNRGLITNLSRDRFHVTAFLPQLGTLDPRIARAADQVVRLPASLASMRERVATEALDLLFYTDIGMEPATFFLAFARLAPVQCVTWGHPVTSGIPTIDYFLSSDDLEPAGAEQHYTERLIRFQRLSTYYYRPLVDARAVDRGRFGFDEHWTLYVCPQSLFKLHPEFDAVVGEILRRDPTGRLILLEGQSRHWSALLRARFAQTSPELAERTVFVPRLTRSDYLNLLQVADVLLDPPHFSGGNSSLEALAVGAPIVTWPGPYLRSRITAACYRKMDLMDGVVSNRDDYVTTALKLAHDRSWRDEIVAKIRARNQLLYEDIEVVRETETFFKQAIVAARRGQGRVSVVRPVRVAAGRG
jgi:protein O-GlcNAc transferase